MNGLAEVLAQDEDTGFALAAHLAPLGLRWVVATTSAELMALEDPEEPALALVEVEAGGLSACQRIVARYDDRVPVILFSSTRTAPLDRVAGFLLGADDYLVAPVDGEELLCRVRRSLRRRSGSVMGGRPDLLAHLSGREREVLQLLVLGLTQRQIAARLVLSEKTVGTHIQHVLTKLDVHRRGDAVALALRAGEHSS